MGQQPVQPAQHPSQRPTADQPANLCFQNRGPEEASATPGGFLCGTFKGVQRPSLCNNYLSFCSEEWRRDDGPILKLKTKTKFYSILPYNQLNKHLRFSNDARDKEKDEMQRRVKES